MKNLLFFISLTLLTFSCEKDEFDLNNPDVAQFVSLIKSGSYTMFEKDEMGENLWLMMPKFTEDHIASLIFYAKDTSHITDYPFNPMSSRSPWPWNRQYCILGEYLLWTVEGIRNGSGYGSLDPYMIDTSAISKNTGLTGSQLLEIRYIYSDWWDTNMDGGWRDVDPLENSRFRWF